MEAAALNIENGAATLSGDLTFATATALFTRMMAVSKHHGMPRSLDLADVRRIDSAGLALLLEWQSAFRKQADTSSLMEIRNPPDALVKIARLCDAEEYLTTEANRNG